MEIVQMNIADVKPYDRNPRINDNAVEAVTESIKEFGWRAPIVVDDNHVIICGHTRLLAAKQLGLDTVPVHVAKGLTPEQVKAYRIADNKTGEIAEWNYDLLPLELADLQMADFDLSLLGFNAAELDSLLNGENTVADGETDPEAIPEVPEEPVSQSGEIYQLGNHILMCGDSTSPEDVSRLMNGKEADMVFTDPPYGVSYKGVNNPGGREWEVIENDDLRGDKLSEFLLAAFKNIKAHLKSKRAFYIWYATRNHIQFESAIIDAGLKSKQVIVWNKGMILGHSDYHWAFEPCFYGCHADENCEWLGDRCQTTVWDIKRDHTGDYVHPTQKPTTLAQKAIFNSSKVGETLLDLFGGSGSTLIACEQTNRKCRMMEFDPKYADVIRRRYAEFKHGEGCNWQELTPVIKQNQASKGER
jgi:site-specific DNA-methyltransferase (adenine-specific)